MTPAEHFAQRHPRVFDELETMRRVAEGNLSMARYGRCELRLMQGQHALAQAWAPDLARALRKVMRKAPWNVMLCLPRVFEGMPPGKTKWYAEFTSKAAIKDLFPNDARTYGSTFVTRRDGWVDMRDEDAYWELVRSIWQDRPVMLVHGSDKGLMARDSGFLGNAASLQVLQSTARDAWGDRTRITEECVRWAEIARQQHPLVYLSLGATATVLVYDLTLLGIQALDMGHAAQSWSGTGKQANTAASDTESMT